MKITLEQFGGQVKALDGRRISDYAAQVAANCDLRYADLRPLPDVGPVVSILTRSGTQKTLYRWGKSLQTDAQYWFSFADVVSVVKGQVRGDSSERTYFAGQGIDRPRCTDQSSAISSAPYPAVSYSIGCPAPDQAITVQVTGTAAEGSQAETRCYIERFVNSWSAGMLEPTMASPVSAQVTISPGQTATLTLNSAPPSGPYVVTRRQIFRTNLGSSGDFQLVADLPIGTTSFSDTLVGTQLGEVLDSTTWSPPPTSLKYLANLGNGIMAGADGYDVMFCEAYRPYAWPYRTPVDDIVTGMCSTTSGLLVVGTTGRPWIFSGVDPSAMTPQPIDCSQACVSGRSMVDMGCGVVYAGADGFVLVEPTGAADVISRALFTPKQYAAISPATIFAGRYDTLYVGFFDGGGGFSFDPKNPAGTFSTHGINATACYREPATGNLYVVLASDKTVRRWMGGADLPVTWRSKVFDSGRPTNVCVADYQCSGRVVLNLYGDGVLRATKTLQQASAGEPVQETITLPGGYMAQLWEVELIGSGTVSRLQLASNLDELRG